MGGNSSKVEKPANSTFIDLTNNKDLVNDLIGIFSADIMSDACNGIMKKYGKGDNAVIGFDKDKLSDTYQTMKPGYIYIVVLNVFPFKKVYICYKNGNIITFKKMLDNNGSSLVSLDCEINMLTVDEFSTIEYTGFYGDGSQNNFLIDLGKLIN